MVEPISAILMTKGLGSSAVKQGGTEAAVAVTAQSSNLDSMVKAGRVPDSQAARAAEHVEVTNKNKLKPRIVSKRNKNFPQPKQGSLGNGVPHTGDSDGIATDAAWATSGAQTIAPGQGLEGGQNSDPWSLATSARRLNEIDSDYVGRRLNLAA